MSYLGGDGRLSKDLSSDRTWFTWGSGQVDWCGRIAGNLERRSGRQG